MAVEVQIPELGESIREVQIVAWLAREGESIDKDQNLVQIESEKATVDLPSPAAGVLHQVRKSAGQSAEVGEVIGVIEPAGSPQPPPPSRESPAEPPPPRPSPPVAEPPSAEPPSAEPPSAEPPSAEPPSAEPAVSEPSVPWGREERVVPMSPIRQRIALRLVEAQRTAALLTTFNEIDMTAVQELRRKYREAFQAMHGVKLGLMSFFVKVTVESLRQCPELNAEVRGTQVAYRDFCDIGIAVGGGKGLVVPVLRDAQRMSFAQIEQAIDDFATRAQANRLRPDELSGGTFTITNGGVYGSLLSTPLINPPQSGILGLHAIQDRPVARDGQVVIRPMMYVALTYDHRIVDGREAVGFLRRVKDLIEDPSRMLLEM